MLCGRTEGDTFLCIPLTKMREIQQTVLHYKANVHYVFATVHYMSSTQLHFPANPDWDPWRAGAGPREGGHTSWHNGALSNHAV